MVEKTQHAALIFLPLLLSCTGLLAGPSSAHLRLDPSRFPGWAQLRHRTSQTPNVGDDDVDGGSFAVGRLRGGAGEDLVISAGGGTESVKGSTENVDLWLDDLELSNADAFEDSGENDAAVEVDQAGRGFKKKAGAQRVERIDYASITPAEFQERFMEKNMPAILGTLPDLVVVSVRVLPLMLLLLKFLLTRSGWIPARTSCEANRVLAM